MAVRGGWDDGTGFFEHSGKNASSVAKLLWRCGPYSVLPRFLSDSDPNAVLTGFSFTCVQGSDQVTELFGHFRELVRCLGYLQYYFELIRLKSHVSYISLHV